jgi:MFS family permease
MSRKALWMGIGICALASLFYVYDYFVQVAPSVMTHSLMAAFHMDAAGMGLLGSCFFVTYTLMQVPAGLLLDHVGARWMLTTAAAISGVGVLLFSLAHVLWVAAIARALIGLGSAFAFLSTVSLISRWFAHHYFAFLIGFLQFAGALGSIFGQGPLALLINHEGWREAMMWIGLGSMVLSVLFACLIRDQGPYRHVAHSSPSVKVGLGKVLKNAQVWWIAVCGYVAWAPASAFAALWGVPFLMKAYHLQNSEAGGLFTLFWLVVGLGGPVIGWWSDRIQRRCLPIRVGFVLGFLASLGLLFAGDYPLWGVGVLLFFLGVSVSVQSLTFGVMKDRVPEDHFATASGVNNMITVLSGAMLQPLIGEILSLYGASGVENGSPVYSLHAYQCGLTVVPVVMLLGLWVAVFKVKETYCRQGQA